MIHHGIAVSDLALPDVVAVLSALQAEGLITFTDREKGVHVMTPETHVIVRPRAVKDGIQLHSVSFLREMMLAIAFPVQKFW